MLIIAGHLEVDVNRRDASVAAHLDLVVRGREAPACLDLAITADPVDPNRVNNFERWESREHLNAWREVAAAPDTGISIDRDDVMEYEVTCVRLIIAPLGPSLSALLASELSLPAGAGRRQLAVRRTAGLHGTARI
jgi:quinol monooxygenase YgiN